MENVFEQFGTALLQIIAVLGMAGILMALLQPGALFNTVIVNYMHSICG